MVRSHGPRMCGKLDQQRSTFAGATHELEPGECSDLQAAVFAANG